MITRKRVIIGAVALLAVGGAGLVVYVKTRRSTDDLALYFLNRCGERDYATAERLLEDHPELATYRLDMYGPTLLHVAAEGWISTRPLEILLAHNADINAKDGMGRTPLQRALKADRVATVEFLLARGGTVGDKAKDVTLRDLIARLKQQYPDIKVIDSTSRPVTDDAE